MDDQKNQNPHSTPSIQSVPDTQAHPIQQPVIIKPSVPLTPDPKNQDTIAPNPSNKQDKSTSEIQNTVHSSSPETDSPYTSLNLYSTSETSTAGKVLSASKSGLGRTTLTISAIAIVLLAGGYLLVHHSNGNKNSSNSALTSSNTPKQTHKAQANNNTTNPLDNPLNTNQQLNSQVQSCASSPIIAETAC